MSIFPMIAIVNKLVFPFNNYVINNCNVIINVIKKLMALFSKSNMWLINSFFLVSHICN